VGSLVEKGVIFMGHCKDCGTPLGYWEIWRAFFKRIEQRQVRCPSCGQQHSLGRQRYLWGIVGGLTGVLIDRVLGTIRSQPTSALLSGCLVLFVWAVFIFIAPMVLKMHKIPEVGVGR